MTRPRSGRGLAALLTAFAMSTVGLVGACARQGAPPGGPRDLRPPIVVSTVPDTFSVDTAFTGPVRFKFDERISERVASGVLNDAVVVSPQSGEVKVSHSRSGLEVKMAGGFKPGMVYRVTLLPVIRDMFNNRLHDPFDLVFSTGGKFVNSAVAGMVWDRITGAPMKDMEVRAVPTGDSTTDYVARSDSAGIYVFRYLPPGHYGLTAFEDRNRNGKVDPTEARGLDSVTLSGPDTILPLDMAALRPDTNPPRVKGAIALDSVTVVVSLDHYIDPDEPAADIHADLSRDSGSAPGVAHLYKEYGYNRWVAQFRDSLARADSIAAAAKAAAMKNARANPSAGGRTPTRPAGADTTKPARPDTTKPAGADTTKPAKPTAPTPAPKRYLPPPLPGGSAGARPAPRGRSGGGTGLGPDGKPLPKQRIVLVLDSALVPGVAYRVQVRGVRTVSGVPMAGGDTTRVTLKAQNDTTKATKDTTKAVKDTAKAGKDTANAAKDTTRRARDTSAVEPAAALSRGTTAILDILDVPGRREREMLRLPAPVALPAKRGGRR